MERCRPAQVRKTPRRYFVVSFVTQSYENEPSTKQKQSVHTLSHRGICNEIF